jgi:hypothetical protein
MELKHKEEILKLREEHSRQLSLNDKSHAREITMIQNNHIKKLTALEKEHNHAVSELQKELQVQYHCNQLTNASTICLKLCLNMYLLHYSLSRKQMQML